MFESLIKETTTSNKNYNQYSSSVTFKRNASSSFPLKTHKDSHCNKGH